MTFLQPLAWIALAGLAVPILIHLRARRPPPRVPFPALRFLHDARARPARRRTLHDVPLLVVRAAILTLAVAAIAQPVIPALHGRARASTSRAIVIDASASMTRVGAGGQAAIDDARALAAPLTRDVPNVRTVEAPAVAPAVTRAAGWLASQPAPRELVVLSDWQRGTLTAADLAAVPADAGITLTRVDAAPVPAASWPAIIVGDAVVEPAVTLEPDRTTVTWQPRGAATQTAPDVDVAGGDDERPAIALAQAAAADTGLPAAADRAHAITILLPHAPDRDARLARATAIRDAWMVDVARAIDRLPSPDGRPRVRALADGGTPPRLLLVADHALDAAPLASVIVSALTARGDLDRAATVGEREPGQLSIETTHAWERAPAPIDRAPGSSDDRVETRWAWAAAAVLIAIEWWMRGRGRASAESEVRRARVA